MDCLGGGGVRIAKQVMASNGVSTGERLLALIDDIELISKYVIISHVFYKIVFAPIPLRQYTHACMATQNN
jgi:hypothetical protein